MLRISVAHQCTHFLISTCPKTNLWHPHWGGG